MGGICEGVAGISMMKCRIERRLVVEKEDEAVVVAGKGPLEVLSQLLVVMAC